MIHSWSEWSEQIDTRQNRYRQEMETARITPDGLRRAIPENRIPGYRQNTDRFKSGIDTCVGRRQYRYFGINS